MRASELLDARVVTADGHPVGVVTGLRCSFDTDDDGRPSAPLVRELVVSSRRVGGALGYQQEAQHGPWLVHRVIRALHRDTRTIDVRSIESVDEGTIRLA
jgi:hypothetical protein